MSTFPNIADYAFLSDCEVSTLIAPDGAVEWLCLPRPDSPSVFGALLDRSAGFFRFGPANTEVPEPAPLHPRHQHPGDHLAHADRLADRHRPARDRTRAHGRAPRRATDALLATRSPRALCCGSRRAAADGSRCRPTASRSSTTAAPPGDVDLRRRRLRARHRHARRPHARARGQLAARDPRPAYLRPDDARTRRDRMGGVVVGRPRADDGRRGVRAAERHREVLARLAEPRDVRGPSVAALHRAQRACAQGRSATRRPVRSWPRAPRRCPRRPAASATGTTATRGSATPRSCCARCTISASTGKRSSTSRSSSTRSPDADPGELGSPDHVRDRR